MITNSGILYSKLKNFTDRWNRMPEGAKREFYEQLRIDRMTAHTLWQVMDGFQEYTSVDDNREAFIE